LHLRRERKLTEIHSLLRVGSLCLLFGSVCNLAFGTESTCYGTPSAGRIENAVQIADHGSNFTPYSSLGVLIGRTYVHSQVASVVEAAYEALRTMAPEKHFVYGETGWKDGGKFKPHKTHQNGLAVDFMVPVQNTEGVSVSLPTSALNKFGYAIEFDSDGKFGDFTIDFEAISTHLVALNDAARAQGIGISRVIFERSYLPKLYLSTHGTAIKESIAFMQTAPWIRHDEHYHVDFAISCKPN
jgi:penicillin-insensitive murein endopeptidase